MFCTIACLLILSIVQQYLHNMQIYCVVFARFYSTYKRVNCLTKLLYKIFSVSISVCSFIIILEKQSSSTLETSRVQWLNRILLETLQTKSHLCLIFIKHPLFLFYIYIIYFKYFVIYVSYCSMRSLQDVDLCFVNLELVTIATICQAFWIEFCFELESLCNQIGFQSV